MTDVSGVAYANLLSAVFVLEGITTAVTIRGGTR